jgi:peroxiredoxin
MNTARRRLLSCALLAPAALHAKAVLREWSGPDTPPPLELRTIDGTPYALQSQLGKVVLVNFWATWCEPCIEEMPSMQQLRDRLGGEGLEIIGVNFKEGEPRIRTFLQKTPVTFPLLRDTDGAVARAWQVRIFPSTFVLDRRLRIRYALVGAIDWASDDATGPLRALLLP